jgi:hypothetical protein
MVAGVRDVTSTPRDMKYLALILFAVLAKWTICFLHSRGGRSSLQR